mgnify:CR=1 FL=1
MYLKNYNLKNKTAVVTGAGKGLGRACAIALAEAGSNLIIISRTKKDLVGVSKIIKKLKILGINESAQLIDREIDDWRLLKFIEIKEKYSGNNTKIEKEQIKINQIYGFAMNLSIFANKLLRA